MAAIFSSCHHCMSTKNISPSENAIPHFINKSITRIHCKHWHPPNSSQKPSALVYICHGVGEHCDRYTQLVSTLTKEGFFVFSNDHVGHGHSEGDRAHIKKFTDYIDDVVQYVKLVQEKFGDIDVPTFAIGHSMGGTIILRTTLDYPQLFKGVILIAPAVVPDPRTATPMKITLAKAVAFIKPQFQVDRIKPEWISGNKDVVSDYESDPLVYHGGLKARWCVEILNTLDDIKKRMSTLQAPLLLVHGDGDMICALSGSQLLHKEAGSEDKTLKVYQGALHQVHNEVEPHATNSRNDIAQWIVARTE